MKRLLLSICLFTFVVGTPKTFFPERVAHANLAKQARRLLKRFKHEPTIRQVHKAALRNALVTQGRIQSLFTRARVSGWLPEVRARYNYNTDDDRSTSFPTPSSPILTVQSTDLDHRLEFRLTWNLDRLVFNKNEMSVYKELKKLMELRTDILKEITKLYFERRRLQVNLIINPPKGILAMVRQKLRLQELTADLDALSGGYFSRKLKAAGHNPYR